MAEEPDITTRGADPERTSYGAVVYGLKVLIDSLAQATGLRASIVVAALGGLGVLIVAVVTGAGVLLFAIKPGEAPAGPPAFPIQQASSGPTAPAPPRGGNSASIPKSAMMVIPGMGPRQTDAEQAEPEQDQSSEQDLPISAPPEFEASSRKNVAPPKDAKRKKAAIYPEDVFEKRPMKDNDFYSLQDPKNKPPAQSGAQMDRPKEVTGKVDEYAKEVSQAYGDGLPGVPQVPEGRSLGPSVEALKAPKRSKEKIEGPVVQKEVPEVGPGRKVTDEPTGTTPKGGVRISAGSDPLSTPIDINKIQLDPSRTHNIDQTSGVQIIGK